MPIKSRLPVLAARMCAILSQYRPDELLRFQSWAMLSVDCELSVLKLLACHGLNALTKQSMQAEENVSRGKSSDTTGFAEPS